MYKWDIAKIELIIKNSIWRPISMLLVHVIFLEYISPNSGPRINFIQPANKDIKNGIGVVIYYIRIFLVFTNSSKLH